MTVHWRGRSTVADGQGRYRNPLQSIGDALLGEFRSPADFREGWHGASESPSQKRYYNLNRPLRSTARLENPAPSENLTEIASLSLAQLRGVFSANAFVILNPDYWTPARLAMDLIAGDSVILSRFKIRDTPANRRQVLAYLFWRSLKYHQGLSALRLPFEAISRSLTYFTGSVDTAIEAMWDIQSRIAEWTSIPYAPPAEAMLTGWAIQKKGAKLMPASGEASAPIAGPGIQGAECPATTGYFIGPNVSLEQETAWRHLIAERSDLVQEANRDIVRSVEEACIRILAREKTVRVNLRRWRIPEAEINAAMNALREPASSFFWFDAFIEDQTHYMLGAENALAANVIRYLRDHDNDHKTYNDLIDEYVLHEALERTSLQHEAIIKFTRPFFRRGEADPLNDLLDRFIRYRHRDYPARVTRAEIGQDRGPFLRWPAKAVEEPQTEVQRRLLAHHQINLSDGRSEEHNV
jgi:hypothetical protein